jgi:hypothetical protein
VPELHQPSPTAASLGKFAEVPVGLYAGKPQVSVPLHEATGIDLSLPISLSYQGGGIKVDEIPGWAGMGWTLQAGGAITRSVQGTPDEKSGGYTRKGDELDEYWHLAQGGLDENDPDFLAFVNGYLGQHIIPGGWDAQPDQFYFNFAGQSGQFVLDTDGDAHPIPNDNTRIEMRDEGEGHISWVVTTSDGTVYIFEDMEISHSGNARDPVTQWPSTWYLTEVRSPAGEVIELDYESMSTDWINHEYQSYYSEYYGKDGFCDLPQGVQQNPNYISTKPKRLTTIITEQERIEFDASPRLGFLAEEEHMIDGITVHNRATNSIKKRVNLTYEARSIFDNRLLLTDVETTTGSATTEPKRYAFEYIEAEGLPERLSPNIDFWGYYNGADNGNTIPEIRRVNHWGDIQVYDGANRNPNPTTMEAGVLEAIHYPTGGTATFDYEPHTFSEVAMPGASRVTNNRDEETEPFEVSISEEDGDSYKEYISESFTVDNAQSLDYPTEVVVRYHHGYIIDGNSGTLDYCEGNRLDPDWPDEPCVSINIIEDGSIIRHEAPETIDRAPWPGAPPHYGNGSETAFTFDAMENKVYEIEVALRSPSAEGVEIGVKAWATWTESVESPPGEDPEVMAGGVRVRKVTMQPGVGTPDITTYDYNQSGVLTHNIRNYYTVESGQCYYVVHESNPVSGLGTTQGNPVGYGHVTVINGPNRFEADGWTDHHFSTAADVMVYSPGFVERGVLAPTFGQYTSVDYLAGYEERTEVYQNAGNGSGQLVERTTREYEKKLSWATSPDEISTRSRALFAQNNIPDKNGKNSTYYHTYHVEAPWIYLRAKTQETFDPSDGESGPQTVVTTTHDYEEDVSSPALKQRRSERVEASGRPAGEAVRETVYEYAHEHHAPQMGPSGTHQLAEVYRTTVRNAIGTALRRSWTTWQRNDAAGAPGWVPDEEWVWTGTN